ncbi:MAG: hypothetical protein ACRC3Y_16300 [Romboutsia sp.]|uniref:hypothetical protein n=1 Tax=Romboutsia sp. TaxID=1965302 RepID=UPI003F38F943
MDIKPLIGISYELIFQIFNTIFILVILLFIMYGIYRFINNIKGENKYENRIIDLESKIKELENEIKKN